MNTDSTSFPHTDPTSIFELFRGSYATELLTAAVAHFGIFGRLAESPASFNELKATLALEDRPLHVLLTALRAMALLHKTGESFSLTSLAQEHLVPGGPFDVGNYLSLAAQSPGVLAMVRSLQTNQPVNFDNDSGTAFIYRDGLTSAMDQTESARHFTLALSGRAKNVAPHLAANIDLSQARSLLDVGGGTGIYAIEMVKRYPQLKAMVLDRPEVLRVAEEFVREHDVVDRVRLIPGDMFAEAWPAECDVILLSNILHDWDVPECRKLIDHCAKALPSGGRLLIHDVFLNDALDGPLPIALYSAALFTLTEGRAYSAAEYRGWMESSGLHVGEVVPTLIHCGALAGRKV